MGDFTLDELNALAEYEERKAKAAQGKPTATSTRNRGACSSRGCASPAGEAGYCTKHYREMLAEAAARRGGE